MENWCQHKPQGLYKQSRHREHCSDTVESRLKIQVARHWLRTSHASRPVIAPIRLWFQWLLLPAGRSQGLCLAECASRDCGAVPYLQPQFSETSRKSHCFAVFPVFFLVGIMEWWLLSSLYVRAETWGPREQFSYTNSPSEKFLNKVSVVVNHRQDFLFMEIKKKMEKKKKKEKYKEECPEDTCIPVCLLRAK